MSRVFERYGSYHIDLGRDEDGRRRSKKLCRVSEGESALYAALSEHTKPKATTVSDLLRSFKMFGMNELAPRTQADYRNYIDNQLDPTFGHMDPEDVTSVHCAQYLERRKPKARVGANKELACFASAFQYGMRVGLCSRDPTKGVKRNRVKPRKRYVRHDEFLLYFDPAPPELQDIMAGIYLMELRPHEARDLRQSAITPNGVLLEESKTDKMKLVTWTPALRFVITRATSRAPESPFIFTNSRGEKWTKEGMHSSLRRVRAGLPDGSPRWHFHDLRAKGESDHEESGHGLLQLYKRASVVKAVR